MRGKVPLPFFADSLTGITPAYAGKSGLRSKVERNDGDHPRLCGEKQYLYNFLTIFQGSPPPMRGKAIDSTDASDIFGITPAYAGKREFRRVQTSLLQDHPRLCGEKLQDTVQQIAD